MSVLDIFIIYMILPLIIQYFIMGCFCLYNKNHKVYWFEWFPFGLYICGGLMIMRDIWKFSKT